MDALVARLSSGVSCAVMGVSGLAYWHGTATLAHRLRAHGVVVMTTPFASMRTLLGGSQTLAGAFGCRLPTNTDDIEARARGVNEKAAFARMGEVGSKVFIIVTAAEQYDKHVLCGWMNLVGLDPSHTYVWCLYYCTRSASSKLGVSVVKSLARQMRPSMALVDAGVVCEAQGRDVVARIKRLLLTMAPEEADVEYLDRQWVQRPVSWQFVLRILVVKLNQECYCPDERPPNTEPIVMLSHKAAEGANRKWAKERFERGRTVGGQWLAPGMPVEIGGTDARRMAGPAVVQLIVGDADDTDIVRVRHLVTNETAHLAPSRNLTIKPALAFTPIDYMKRVMPNVPTEIWVDPGNARDPDVYVERGRVFDLLQFVSSPKQLRLLAPIPARGVIYDEPRVQAWHG